MKTNPITTAIGKWRSLRNWITAAFLLPLLSMTGVMQAQVTNIIYQDNFARVGPLDGSAPDTVNVPGATWFACNDPGLNAQIQTDGSEIALTNTPGTTNGVYLNGFLPFVPTVGHIYYLSCNIQPLSGGTNWLALGFATHALTNNFFNTYQCGAGWLGVRGNGTNISPWGSITGNSSFTNAVGNNFQTFTVVLDTTFGNGAGGLPNGNSQQGWQIRFYTNNVLVPGGNQTIAWGNYPIKYVGIGADRAQGNFQNFTLTDVLMRQGSPTIVEQPQNATAQVGQTATFWVGVTNDYPVGRVSMDDQRSQWSDQCDSRGDQWLLHHSNAGYVIQWIKLQRDYHQLERLDEQLQRCFDRRIRTANGLFRDENAERDEPRGRVFQGG